MARRRLDPIIGGIYRRGRHWWHRYSVAGKEVRERLPGVKPTDDRHTAVKRHNELVAPLAAGRREERLRRLQHQISDTAADREQLEDDAAGDLAVADAWEQFVALPTRKQVRDSTLSDYHSIWKRFKKWWSHEHRATPYLYQVRPSHGEEYAQDLTDYSASRYNQHVMICRMIFRELRRYCRHQPNPFGKTSKAGIQNRPRRQNHRRDFTEDEVKLILEESRGDCHRAIVIGLYTGLRLGDVCTLQWSEVRLQDGILSHRMSKKRNQGGDIVKIPIAEPLREMFEKTPPDERRGYVLQHWSKRYLDSDGTATAKLFSDFLKRCGLQVYAPGTGGKMIDGKWHHTGKRAVVELGFHSLRHSFVSMCARNGVPLPVVQALVGHESAAIQQVYLHMGVDVTRAAISGLPKIGEKPGGPSRRPDQAWHQVLKAKTLADAKAIARAALNEGVSSSSDV